jgi:hypothetical protein
VIYHFTQFLTLPPVELYAPELFQYLVERFEMVRTFHGGPFGYKVAALRREDGPPPGRPLLGDAALGGALRVERYGRTERVEGRARDAMLRRELWPFRPVIALRPTAGGASVLALPMHPQPGERLHTAIGAHPTKWFGYPPMEVGYGIAVVEDGVRTPLFQRTLEPQKKLEERGWTEVELPLDAFAGRDVTLELSTSTGAEPGETPLLGGFAEPRLVQGTAP